MSTGVPERLFRQREVLLNEAEVRLAGGRRTRQRTHPKDEQRHALAGGNLMLRNLATLLFDSEDDVACGQAAEHGWCGSHNAAPFVLWPLQLCRQRSEIGSERHDRRPSNEAHVRGANVVIAATGDKI